MTILQIAFIDVYPSSSYRGCFCDIVETEAMLVTPPCFQHYQGQIPQLKPYFICCFTMLSIFTSLLYCCLVGSLTALACMFQAPFPNPLDAVKNLLDVSKYSSQVQAVQQKEFVQKVINWALNFAVTTQQKEMFIGYLQSQFNSDL